MLVRDCRALSSSELPGSDAFTRSPHPRTAAGLSSDAKTLYLVVADGKVAEGVTGVTLPALATFMREQLGVCEAVNFDGGGSSAMVIKGRKMTTARGGEERAVANHIAVVAANDLPQCVNGPSSAASVSNSDFWNDVREITRTGTAEGKTFTIELARNVESTEGTKPAFAAIRLQRLSSGVLVTGVVPFNAGERDSFDEITGSTTSLKTAMLNGQGVRWGVLAGRIGSIEAAHIIRKLMDELSLSASAPNGSLNAPLRAVKAHFGRAATATNGGLRVTVAQPAALSRASDVLFKSSGATTSATGILIVRRAGSERSLNTLRSAGIEVVDRADWLIDPQYVIWSVDGEGDAMNMARAISAVMKR
jgi:hypothetical protein